MPRPRLESASWWPKLLADVNHMSLRDLSEKYNVSINGLSRALRRGGTPKSDSPAPAGRKPAGGRKTAAAPPPVDTTRGSESLSWWPEFLTLKDEMTLGELATRFNVAEITLQRAMKRAGVTRRSLRGQSRRVASPADGSGPIPTPKPVPAQKSALADTNASPALDRAPASSRKSSASSGEAWQIRLRLDGEVLRFVVVGSDIVDAASRARAAIAGRAQWSKAVVEALEYLGPTI